MKKRAKKLTALFMAFALTCGMLSGCGGGNSNSKNNGAKTNDTGGNQSSQTEDAGGGSQSSDAEEPANDGDGGGDADASAGSTPRNETLYFAGQQWGTINDWNPMSANSNNAMGQTQNPFGARTLLYESLFMFNPLDGSLTGLLGKEWSFNDDQSILTVKLNPDAKWSDGTPVTAEDVKYTFDTHVKYQSSTGADLSNYIEKVEAKDDATVEIYSKLDKKGAAKNSLKVESFIAQYYIMQKAYLQKVEERCGEDAEKVKMDTMEDFVASGPYLRYHDDDQKVVFVRDDNYWGQADSMWGKLPAPKYIAHVIYKDNAAGQVALSQGEVDVCQQFITDIQKLWEDEGLPISTYMDEAPYGICLTMPTAWFNCEKPGLDQKEVRKAIAMAVDYNQIISSAMSNQSPSFSDVPRSIANPTDAEQSLIDQEYLASTGLQFTGNDIEGANKILDDAGIVDTDGDGIREYDGNKLSFKAECPEGWSDWNASLEIVAAAGKDIGIEISTYFPDASTYYDDLTTFNFDIIMQSVDPSSVMSPWSRCMQYFSAEYADIPVNWSGNWGHYVNKEANEILEKIPHETDEAKLKEYYTRLSEIYLDEVPSFSLMYRPAMFHSVNESVWTGFPEAGDGKNIPPLVCTDGYGIAALYNIHLVEE